MKFEGMQLDAVASCRAARQAQVFHSIPAPYQLIACFAGETEPVHEKILERCFEQYVGQRARAGRHPDLRHPVHLARTT